MTHSGKTCGGGGMKHVEIGVKCGEGSMKCICGSENLDGVM